MTDRIRDDVAVREALAHGDVAATNAALDEWQARRIAADLRSAYVATRRAVDIWRHVPVPR